MTSSAPPQWAVGDDADLPRPRTGLADAFDLEAAEDALDQDVLERDGGGLIRFSTPWWTRALTEDPLTGSIAERRRIRPAIASATAGDPGPAQLAALDALLAAVGPRPAPTDHCTDGAGDDVAAGAGAGAGDGAGTVQGVGLSSREWTEVTAASFRCGAYLHAVQLNFVAGLDAATLAEKPSRAAAKDSRRPASDELAPVLRIAGRTATALVGLARQLGELPAAEDALIRGQMTPSQLEVLAEVCRRLPQGPAGDAARRLVEARAVAAAVTLSRARLASALAEAALEADPGYAARCMAAGIQEREVVLRRSPTPGCQRLVADLETADAARVWQVINQIAANAKDGDTYTDPADPADPADAADADGEEQGQERRTLAQLRADVLVSLVVGEFSATPQMVTKALSLPLPGDQDDDADAAADAGADDEDEDEDDDADAGGQRPATGGGIAPDTRKLVRIPTPQQRARLSEIHIVVLADDLADDDAADPDQPDDGPGDPGEGPGDTGEGPSSGPSSGPSGGPSSGPSGGAPPPDPSPAAHHRKGPSDPSRPTNPTSRPTGCPTSTPTNSDASQADSPPVGSSPTPPPASGPGPGRERHRSTPAQPFPHPSGQSGSPATGAAGHASTAAPAASVNASRLVAARRARAARRPLAGYGPFGYLPGIGRLAPHITRAAIRAARWRRLVADEGTGVLVHRSRWTLPAPDTVHDTVPAATGATPTSATASTSTNTSTATRARSTAEHLGVLLDQHAAPDLSDPADPGRRVEVSYRPSTLLAAHVRARDGVCISPVCQHPARAGATQLDHTIAWGAATATRLRGGLTEAGNLGCICQRWHTAKTHGGWELVQSRPGSFTWTSPTGRVYHRRATPVLPDLTHLID